jgi:glutathione synthase
MLKAAASRGCETQAFGQGDLWVRDGRAFARLTPIEVVGEGKAWYRTGAPAVHDLAGIDVVLMRKDPPFDMEYICTTYLLERAEQAGVLVVNRPQGLRDMNEKAYTAWFPDCCAPTLISRDMAAMETFLAEQGQAVFKPLDGMGGRSIFVVERGERNVRVVLETLTDYGRRYAIAQRYLPEIATAGDARILLVDGEPVPHALVRMPAAGDHRGNLAAGATAESRALTERDRWLASRIGPVMRERGMLFVGLDVIGGFVTEINVTSPTGIREIEARHGHDVGGMLVDAVLARLARR